MKWELCFNELSQNRHLYTTDVLIESLLRPEWIRSSLRFFFFKMLNSPTSANTIKIASHSNRFLLHSFYVIQVCTMSDGFYIDKVGTWSSVIRGSRSLMYLEKVLTQVYLCYTCRMTWAKIFLP